MKVYRYTWIVFLFLLSIFNVSANTHSENKGERINARALVLDHIQDAYEWHITTWGDRHIRIPLPVIVYSPEKGWNCFLSSRLHEGNIYNGFKIDTEGKYKGKLIERNTNGKWTRPLDLSLTKTATSLIINSILLIIIILYVASWYRKHTPQQAAPKGFVGFMEMLIMMIEEDIIRSCVGKDYKRFSPYLLTAFFFIFLNNLMGLIPIFPGGGNVTGNIAVTMVLAICTFIAVNVLGTKEYWKEILWPDVPWWLKAPIPLMPVIELFGIFTKPFALMIRLFANIIAGHFIVLALTSIVFVAASMGPVVSGSMSFVSVLFSIFMNSMEILVAFIQAYVFTMLSAVFIGMSRVRHEVE